MTPLYRWENVNFTQIATPTGYSHGSVRQWQERVVAIGHNIPSLMLIVATAVVTLAAFQKHNTGIEEQVRTIASKSKRQ